MPTVHDGHRQRLRDRYCKTGFLGFQQHEILELLLSYAIPRADVNPIAHRLIETFGSVSGVLDAPASRIEEVPGMGSYSATLLKMIPELARVYLLDKSCDREPLNSPEKVGEFLRYRFIGEENERVYAVVTDSKCTVLDHGFIGEGSIGATGINIRRIVDMAVAARATGVILAHNHPRGIALPSPQDVSTTVEIQRALRAVQLTLIDHLIVSADADYVSMAVSKEYRSIFE